MAPACEDVASGEIRVLIDDIRCGRRDCRNPDAFSGLTIVDIALDGYRIAARNIPIGAKATLHPSPVVKLTVIEVELRTSCEAFTVNSVTKVPVIASSVADVKEALIHIATARRYESAAR